MSTTMPAKTTTALGAKDRAMLVAVARFHRERGYSPTVREMQAALGLSSTSVAVYRLDRLRDLGMLARDPNVARSIRLLCDTTRWEGVGA